MMDILGTKAILAKTGSVKESNISAKAGVEFSAMLQEETQRVGQDILSISEEGAEKALEKTTAERYIEDFFENLTEEDIAKLRENGQELLNAQGKSDYEMICIVDRMKQFLGKMRMGERTDAGVFPPGATVSYDSEGRVCTVSYANSNTGGRLPPYGVSGNNVFDWLDSFIAQSLARRVDLSEAGEYTDNHKWLEDNVSWAKTLREYLGEIFG